MLPTLVFLSFPGGSAGKKSTCNAGDLGLIPGLGRTPGEGNSYLDFPGSSAGKESTCNAGDPSLILGWEDPLQKG